MSFICLKITLKRPKPSRTLLNVGQGLLRKNQIKGSLNTRTIPYFLFNIFSQLNSDYGYGGTKFLISAINLPI